MLDQRFILVAFFRQRQFQHNLFVGWDRVELFGDLSQQDVFGFGFVGDCNVDLRLDDRNQSMAEDL